MSAKHREVTEASTYPGSDEILDEIIAEHSHLIEQHDWDTYFSFGKTVAGQYLETVLIALSRANIRTEWRCGQLYWYQPTAGRTSRVGRQVNAEPAQEDTAGDSTEHRGLDTLLNHLAEQRLI